MDILERVRAWMEEQRMTESAETILCALSGGADSVCLLHLLRRLAPSLDFRLEAAHFHHGIRGAEADRDRDFVLDLCRELDIPLHLGAGDVPAYARERGMGLEEAGRELRYAFLEETADALPACRIATAHQAEDNAETLLLHLCRGTGLSGLCGIPPVRGRVVRPLLPVAREEILAYLAENRLPHVEDSTNALEEGERNLLRHRVLPVLRELNPGFAEAMLNTTRLLREDEACLRTLAEGLMMEAGGARPHPSAALRGTATATFPGGEGSPFGGDEGNNAWDEQKTGTLPSPGGRWREAPDEGHPGSGRFPERRYSCRKLLAAPRPLSSRALRLGAEALGSSLERKHADALLALASGSGGLAGLDLPGGLRATREFDLLRLRPSGEAAEPYDIPLVWGTWTSIPAGERRVYWGPAAEAGKVHEKFQIFFFKNTNICGSIHVRSRKSGDSLRPAGRNTEKTLKKWMIEKRIPALERETWPVFADDLGVVAVPGLGTAERVSATPAEADGAIILE